jgi:hypothetical protein
MPLNIGAPEPALVDVQLVAIQGDLDEIKATLGVILEYIVKADSAITNIGDQVNPMLKELESSPMLKMLGIGKKK